MPTHRRLATIAAVALALLALLGLQPASGLAADGATVSGTVTRDGVPIAGADVGVLVAGNDMVWHATTDANGAWAVAADIAVGEALQINAMSPVARSSPDENGCVSVSAASGQANVTVDAVPLAPLALSLDHAIISQVCAATASPGVLPTPPATDANAPGSTGGSGTPVLAMLLAVLALLAVGPLARRPGRRA
jgi:hypothetical protein